MVLDLFRDEEKRFAVANFNLSVIHNARQRRHPGEQPHSARAKIRRDRRGGGDETAANFDHRVRPEIETVGVGENDRAIGI